MRLMSCMPPPTTPRVARSAARGAQPTRSDSPFVLNTRSRSLSPHLSLAPRWRLWIACKYGGPLEMQGGQSSTSSLLWPLNADPGLVLFSTAAAVTVRSAPPCPPPTPSSLPRCLRGWGLMERRQPHMQCILGATHILPRSRGRPIDVAGTLCRTCPRRQPASLCRALASWLRYGCFQDDD